MTTTHLLKVSRLESLTDGIFAIAMTIMVLNLRIPEYLPTDNKPLLQYDTYLNLFIYIGSFIILGTHWIAMNFQWGLLERVNRIYLWTSLLYLMVICVIPFSANLLGAYPENKNSIHFYAINLLCASLGQFITFKCAAYHNLYKPNIQLPPILHAAFLRILIAPFFYISSLLISYWSVLGAFILLIAPTVIYMVPGRIDRYQDIDNT